MHNSELITENSLKQTVTNWINKAPKAGLLKCKKSSCVVCRAQSFKFILNAVLLSHEQRQEHGHPVKRIGIVICVQYSMALCLC